VSDTKLSVFNFETERLRLRPADAGDEALFHELYTDPETMRFIGPVLSAEKAANSFKKIISRQLEPSLVGRLLVAMDKVTLQPMGICGTSQYGTDALRLEVGIVLKSEARSRGLAKEALTGLVNRIFALSPIEEICVQFSGLSPAAERLNSRMGFAPCADAIQGEGVLSKRVCSIQRSSWCVNQTAN
jgi:RimJ/RimL family protein N-acetyltransferase